MTIYHVHHHGGTISHHSSIYAARSYAKLFGGRVDPRPRGIAQDAMPRRLGRDNEGAGANRAFSRSRSETNTEVGQRRPPYRTTEFNNCADDGDDDEHPVVSYLRGEIDEDDLDEVRARLEGEEREEAEDPVGGEDDGEEYDDEPPANFASGRPDEREHRGAHGPRSRASNIAGEVEDEPVYRRGMPRPGGRLTGDEALRSVHIDMARLDNMARRAGFSPPTRGEIEQQKRLQRAGRTRRQIALDSKAARRASSNSEHFYAMFPDAAKIGFA